MDPAIPGNLCSSSLRCFSRLSICIWLSFSKLTLRFFGLLDRYVFPSEDLLFGLLYQCIKVLLISLVGEAGVVLTTITLPRQRLRISRFVPINLPISIDAVIGTILRLRRIAAHLPHPFHFSAGDRSGCSRDLNRSPSCVSRKLAKAIYDRMVLLNGFSILIGRWNFGQLFFSRSDCFLDLLNGGSLFGKFRFRSLKLFAGFL